SPPPSWSTSPAATRSGTPAIPATSSSPSPPSRRRTDDGAAGSQPGRPPLPGAGQRVQAAGAAALPRVDRPQRPRPRRDADRALRVHDRAGHLPAQPRAGQGVRQVPRPARRAALPADRGPRAGHVLADRAAGGDAPHPGRDPGGDPPHGGGRRNHVLNGRRPAAGALPVPGSHAAAGPVLQQRAGWLRARVVEAEPGQPRYSASPTITRIAAFTCGGTVDAVNADTVTGEVLGVSEGVPGQRFQVQRRPVVAGDPMALEVSRDAESEDGEGGWEEWTPVADFGG